MAHSPTKLQRKFKGPPTVTRLTTHFISGLMSNLLICKHKREYILRSCMTQKSLLRSDESTIQNSNLIHIGKLSLGSENICSNSLF